MPLMVEKSQGRLQIWTSRVAAGMPLELQGSQKKELAMHKQIHGMASQGDNTFTGLLLRAGKFYVGKYMLE